MFILSLQIFNIIQIAPGFVKVPNLLTSKEEQILGDLRNFRHMKKCSDKDRLRMYAPLTSYSALHQTCYARYLAEATSVDHNLPKCEATHLLTNVYTGSTGLKWHRDIYENDGDEDFTIINLCIGASCMFEYEFNSEIFQLNLHSGDAILFGGPSRFLKHKVKKVLLQDIPTWMKPYKNPYRISYTYRDSVSMYGKEDKFSEFCVNNDDFDKSQAVFEKNWYAKKS